MVIDKRRGWRALLLCTYINLHGPGLWYVLFTDTTGQGDKETFPFSWGAEGVAYHLVESPVEAAGRHKPGGGFSGLAMIQRRPGTTDSVTLP